MMPKQRYRLGIDLGTTSIGTALIRLDGPKEHPFPCGVIHMGVRIFEDGRDAKTKEPLAVTRRLARQARRRRDRYLRRRLRIIQAFLKHSLFPKNDAERKALETLSPYELRAEALDKQIPLHHFGRALFHLSQRRGFKSSRKSGKSDDDGKIKSGIRKLKDTLHSQGYRTLGEFLYRSRIQEGLSVRAREVGSGAKAEYPFYPDRSMIEDEFDILWTAQAKYYPHVCTEEARAEIKDILLFQRPLRPVRPGRCTFESTEDRSPIADPLYQQFRILQDLNHLRILLPGQKDLLLTREQREELLTPLRKGKEIKLDDIKKILRLPNDVHFSIDAGSKDRIKGDAIAATLGKKSFFGPQWFRRSLEEQSSIVHELLTCDKAEELVVFLEGKGLDREAAETLAETDLPSGYGRLSRKAIQKILPFLEADVITYDKAAAMAGYHHSDFQSARLEKLPYYGEVLERHVPRGSGDKSDSDEARFGRIANPTVHIALNQLRRVVNCIIKRFGPPEQIVIELARDLKMGTKQKKELERRQKENENHNKMIDQELDRQGLPRSSENRLRYKLWEELGTNPHDRVCPYTGKSIGINALFSEEIEIEHILPFAQSYDDSPANKTVAYRFANRAKGNRSPYDAFGNSPTISGFEYNWNEILDRSWRLQPNKRLRFNPDAMQQLAENGDFTARQLIDTAYIAKLAREYVTVVCEKNQVWSIPGRLTALLRAKWGLDGVLGTRDDNGVFHKNRNHHGHHAIDALVVALTDRSLLNRLSQNTVAMLEQGQRALARFPLPWDSLLLETRERMGHLVVSHRKDHGLGGPLFNATAYGILSDTKAQSRKPISSLKTTDIDKIKSAPLRQLLEERFVQSGENGWKNVLEEFQQQTHVRRLRLVETISVEAIEDDKGNAYKGYKTDGNYCYDIWEDSDGKWGGRVISRFEANQNRGHMPPKDGPRGTRMLMRLIVNDTVRLEHPISVYWRVTKISEGRITLAPICESGDLKRRDADSHDPFKYLTKSPNKLKELSCEPVHVDECGFVMVS